MSKQRGYAAPYVLAVGLLSASILGGIARVTAQSGPPELFWQQCGVGVRWWRVDALAWKPAPVKQDPTYPYVPNNVGGQPTFRTADINNPNLTQLNALKKVSEEVLAGKPMWSRSARCWPTGVPALLLTPVQPTFFIQTARQVTIIAQHDSDVVGSI